MYNRNWGISFGILKTTSIFEAQTFIFIIQIHLWAAILAALFFIRYFDSIDILDRVHYANNLYA